LLLKSPNVTSVASIGISVLDFTLLVIIPLHRIKTIIKSSIKIIGKMKTRLVFSIDILLAAYAFAQNRNVQEVETTGSSR